MKRLGLLVVVLAALALVPLARSGHELPVYPSYYPHEIEIRTVAPDGAAELLRTGQIHAYVGAGVSFPGGAPDTVRAIESLGSFVVVRINPKSPRAQSACAVRDDVLRMIATYSSPTSGSAGGRSGVLLHPYPVTPFHGDYLHHVDLAEAAKAQVLAAKQDSGDRPTVKAKGALADLVPQDRRADAEWDAELVEVGAGDLSASEATPLNGSNPEWLKAGWFHAERLLGPSLERDARQRIDGDIERLHARSYANSAERINLERDIVRTLTADCRVSVAGYTVKSEYHNAEFSAGIENIAFDSVHGLESPMFLRTVKLKDFPWNGWLALGTRAEPVAAWNPIGGFTDGFGRLMWSAVGDPAVLPSPYDSAWVLNRITDVQATPRR
jgi:hypothetical protein